MEQNELMHGGHKYIKKVWRNGRWRYFYTATGGFKNQSANQNYATVGDNKSGRYVTGVAGKSNSLGNYVGINSGGKKSGSNDYKSVNKKIGGVTVSGEYSKKDKYLDVSVGVKTPKASKAAAKGKAFLKKLFG